MHIAAMIMIALVAIAHVWFLILEMVLWTQPLGLKTFNLTPEVAKSTKTLAANQGLYNGILAAGLFWSLWPIGAEGSAKAIATFFLCAVIIAGLYGAKTVNFRILYVQATPAALALALLWLL